MKRFSVLLYYPLAAGIILNLLTLCHAQSNELEPEAIFCYGDLSDLAYSPDGKHFATSGSGGIFLWDIDSGRMVRHFGQTGVGSTYNFTFSPNGTKILANSSRTSVSNLWDVNTGELIHTFDGIIWNGMKNNFAFDSAIIFTKTSPQRELLKWDVKTGELIKNYGFFGENSTDVIDAAIQTPNGLRVITKHKPVLWDGESKTKIVNSTEISFKDLAISPDRTRLLVVSGDIFQGNFIQVFDLETGELQHSVIDYTDTITSLSANLTFSPDGTKFTIGYGHGLLSLRDAESLDTLHDFQEYPGGIRAVSFSPDGQYLLSGSDKSSVTLWDTNSGNLIRTYTEHASQITKAFFSADGERVFVEGVFPFTGLREERDVDTGIDSYNLTYYQQETGTRSPVPGDERDISQDGSLFLSLPKYRNRTLKLLDADTGEIFQTYGNKETEFYYASFFADDDQIITLDFDGFVRIYDRSTGTEVSFIDVGPVTSSTSFTFSEELKQVLVGVPTRSDMGIILSSVSRLYDLETGELIQTFEGLRGSISPDGKRIATGDDDILKIWNTATGALVYEKEAHPYTLNSHSNSWYYRFYHTKFSPDGRLLLTNGTGGVKLWDISSSEILHTFGPYGEYDEAHSIDFSLDGTKILIAFNDGRIRLWNINNLRSQVQNFELYK